MTSVTAFAPATVSNVACGFDVLGFPLNEPGDHVTARFLDDDGVRIEAIEKTIILGRGATPEEAAGAPLPSDRDQQPAATSTTTRTGAAVETTRRSAVRNSAIARDRTSSFTIRRGQTSSSSVSRRIAISAALGSPRPTSGYSRR